jgi:TRAP-type mannitol/chloroaromatic compound transport system substrate-binding protein
VKKMYLVPLAIILVSFFVFASCTQTSPAAKSTGSPTPSPAPQVFKWRIQSIFVEGDIPSTIAKEELAKLKTITGGRLDVTLFPSGALVGATEMFDAVNKGAYEGNWAAMPSNMTKIDAGFGVLFTAPGLWPAATATRDFKMWLIEGGGLKLWRDALAKKNVYLVGVDVGGNPEGMMSNKALRTLADFKGIKVRTSAGVTSDVFSKLGAVPVNVSKSDLYSALSNKLVDAAEYSSVATNYDLKLNEVSKYVLYPSFHSPTSATTIEVNMDVWNKLPDDLKFAFEYAVHEFTMRYDFQRAASDYDALKKMTDYGLEHIVLSDADMATAEAIGREVVDTYATKSDFSKQVISSAKDFLRRIRRIK